jgi:transposase
MRTRSGLLALVVVAVVAAAAVVIGAIIAFGGSGTASREDYQVAVVNARDRADFALARMTRATSLDELTTRLDEAAATIDDVAGDLDDIGAPDELEATNEQLVRALRALSGEVAGTAETLGDPTFADVIPTLNSLSFPQWEVVNRTLEQLNEQGIEVEQLPRH